MKTTDREQCGNPPFGCGKGYGWTAFHQEVHLCTGCAHRAARTLGVKLADLSLALAAYVAAKAGHGDEEPSLAEVWAILETLGLQRQFYVPPANRHAPADSCLPEADRVAA